MEPAGHAADSCSTPWKGVESLEELRQRMRKFSSEREWNRFHTPRNLLMALVGEVGELAEVFQWAGEVEVGVPEFSPEKKIHLGEELSDVLLYLVRLADCCDVDLGVAVEDKMKKNEEKYPVEAARTQEF